MLEKILNNLVSKKANILDEMKGFLQKTSEGTITNSEKDLYKNKKEELLEIEKSILETKDLMDKEDVVENKSSYKQTKQGKGSEGFMNFVRFGDTSGIDTGSDRGYKNIDRTSAAAVVPTELEKSIRLKINDLAVLRKIARVTEVNSKDKDIPVEGDDVQAAWLDEGSDFSESDTDIVKKTLKPHKNGALVKATTELLEDAVVDIEAYLGYKIAKGLNENFESTALLNTTDNGKKPLGLVAQASVGVETNGGEGVITAKDITALFFSVKQGYRKVGQWLVGTKALNILVDLEDEKGNRLYVPSYAPNIPDTLLGRPVYEIEALDDLAVGKFPIIFGDFGQLEIGVRKGITLVRLNELYRTSGKVGFLAEERIDSVLIFDNAIKTLKIGAEA